MITKAERRILSLIADGLSTHEIMAHLGCCQSNVSQTMCRVYRKLGLGGGERRLRAILMFLTGEALGWER